MRLGNTELGAPNVGSDECVRVVLVSKILK